jgi:enoyl-CoA hydratase/carnithine racemase
MTASRIRYGDALASGIATHAVSSEDIDALAGALEGEDDTDILLAPFETKPEPQTTPQMREQIAAWFSAPDILELFERVESAAAKGNELAETILASFSRNSPTSLAVAFRQINEGGALSLDECMTMEFRIVNRMLRGREFYEGIRAAVIDKDGKPRWEKKSIFEVSAAEVDAYFAPLPGGELRLK